MPLLQEIPTLETDSLVIGTGVAGLQLALKLGSQHRVILLTKSSKIDSNSWYAQGGIAAVYSALDSFEEHCADTIMAGAGLCHEDIVKKVVASGPKLIRELLSHKVTFTTEPATGQLHLTREGGHSQRRIAHVQDQTGAAVIQGLLQAVSKCSKVQLQEDQVVLDLIVSDIGLQNHCLGALVYNKATGELYQIRAAHTFLCTGGHGHVYQYTSNPKSATGDGLAMAWRAGCQVANLEFMQFHPTSLYHPESKNFLITEALRGEGAELCDHQGQPFMKRYHPLGSLAPRDVVARAIVMEMTTSSMPHSYLDARSLGSTKLKNHFPMIWSKCCELGLNLAQDLIPVVPAAHYSCGGVLVDECGRTTVGGLYAIGELAWTGLHGANRLASNSLLEALAFADYAAEAAFDAGISPRPPTLQGRCRLNWQLGSGFMAADEQILLKKYQDEIRQLMWGYVGIIRKKQELELAYSLACDLKIRLLEYSDNQAPSQLWLSAFNMVEVAILTIRCALARQESRGAHYLLDFPNKSAHRYDTHIIGQTISEDAQTMKPQVAKWSGAQGQNLSFDMAQPVV